MSDGCGKEHFRKIGASSVVELCGKKIIQVMDIPNFIIPRRTVYYCNNCLKKPTPSAGEVKGRQK